MSKLTKLTPERHARAIELAKLGMPVTQIAGELRVSRDSIYEWVKRGEKWLAANADADADPPADEAPFVAFALDWRAAEAEDMRNSLTRIRADAKGHRGDQFHLERRYPEVFSARAKHEISGPEGKPIEHSVTAKVVLLPALDADPAAPARGDLAAEPGAPDPVP